MTEDFRFPSGRPPCWCPPQSHFDGRICTSLAFDRASDCVGCSYNHSRAMSFDAIADLIGTAEAARLFPELRR